jgi:hypothetical protein
VVAHQDDLTTEEAAMGDDLIVLLASKGQLDLLPSTTSRAKLWSHVFRSWDSVMPVPGVPPEAPKRDFLKSSLRVGTLAKDADESKNKRAGQPVFIRPFIRDAIPTVGFDYLDKGGELVPAELLCLDEGLTEVRAISEAMTRYETYESHRVNDWNLSVIIVWARRRLQAHLGVAEAVAPRAPSQREDRDQLVQFESVAANWAKSKALILSVELDKDEVDACTMSWN